MAVKNYYELLEVPPNASADEVKKAFRQQIARYHPDKVQHLGQEFQAMAAERAAELTEAYRILSDEGRRAEYDRTRGDGTPAAAAAPPPAAARAPEESRPATDTSSSSGPAPEAAASASGRSFKHERDTRDVFVRKATLERFRAAFAPLVSDYDQAQERPFDIVCVPKPKLFARSKAPRLLGRFVSSVNGKSVAETWLQAVKWGGSSGDEICVFLMGSEIAPPRELAEAIAEQRRKTRGKVTLIPIDARNWDAHVPTDAPDVAKTLLARLRGGT